MILERKSRAKSDLNHENVLSTSDGTPQVSDALAVEEEKDSNGIPVQIWLLCIVYFSIRTGFMFFLSISNLCLLEMYGLSPVQIGYIAFATAMTFMFGLIVIFNVLVKKIGLYFSVIVPYSLFAGVSVSRTYILVRLIPR